MAYWVYENRKEPYPKGKARIHRGCCRWCNYGQGTKKPKPKGIKNGKWHGGRLGYPTFNEAEAVAQQTRRPVSCCKHCKPFRGDPRSAVAAGTTEPLAVAVVDVAREAGTDATGELVTRAHLDTALAQLESRLHAKLDQGNRVSRRHFFSSCALTLIGIAVTEKQAGNPPAPAQDVDFSARLRHGIRGGGEVNIKGGGQHAVRAGGVAFSFDVSRPVGTAAVLPQEHHRLR